jgi:hypothetical protein
MISSTNWLVNDDKRKRKNAKTDITTFTIFTVGDGMHKNKNARNYLPVIIQI